MFNRVIWLLLALLVPVVLLVITHWSQLIHFIWAELTSTKGTSPLTGLLSKMAKAAGVGLLSYVLSRVVAWCQLTEPDSLYTFAVRRRRHPDSDFPLMTMGHTHNPGAYEMQHGGKFYNTGTWIPVIETSSAEVREDRMYTFLHLERDEDGLLQPAADGALQRWNDDAGRGEPQLLIERK